MPTLGFSCSPLLLCRVLCCKGCCGAEDGCMFLSKGLEESGSRESRGDL